MRVLTIIAALLLSVSGLFAFVGKISAVKGDVLIQRGAKELKAVVGSEIEENDTIISKAASRAQLFFKDETVVSIGKESSFKVEGFFYDGDPQNSANNASFNAVKGAFKVMTGKIGKLSPKAFKLTTRTATIGIRGTHFLGQIAEEADRIACTDGKIVVGTLDGQAEVLVNAGQITFVVPGEVPTPPREFSVEEIKSLSKAAANGDKNGAAAKPAADKESEEKEEAKPVEEKTVESVRSEEVVAQVSSFVQEEISSSFLSAKPNLDHEYSWVYAYTDATAHYYSIYDGYYESVDEYISWYDNIAEALIAAQAEYPDWNLVVYKAEKSVLSDNNEFTEWGTWEFGYAYTEAGETIGFNEKGYYLKGDVITPATTVQSFIDSNSQFSYSGSVAGSIMSSSYDETTGTYNEQIVGNIIQDSSSFNTTVDFGAGTVQGNISFNTTNGENWNNTVDGSLTIDQSYFKGYGYDSTTGNSTSLEGTFYGPNAEAIGGEFNVYDSATMNTAIGVFEAKRP